MNRWVVFNGWRTSCAYDFHVYVDAPDEKRARRVAVPFFEHLARKFGTPSDPSFTDPAKFVVVRVSS